MKILVTGNKGFVGINLIDKFKDKITVVKDLQGDRIDVLDSYCLEKVGKVDAVVHLAAKTSIPNSVSHPYDTYYTNLVGTLNILEYAKKNNIDKIINISTYVYGKPEYLPIDENHSINPHSPYNKSKVLAENLCKHYSNDYGIGVVTLRPFYLYGPHGNPNFLIPSVIRQISNSKKVIISNRKTKRDFLFIDDFLELIAKILFNFPKGYNVFNVGYGESHSLEEVILLIGKAIGIKISIQSQDSIRPDDIMDMIADIRKVRNAFDWKPKMDLSSGLVKTISSYNLT